MSRLFDHFVPLFSFGLELDEQIAQGRVERSVADVHGAAKTLIDRARNAALAAGHRPEHVESATFALVAWLDEVVARNPAFWGGSTPLQVALFNTNNAGNEFFYNLGNLKAGEDEVREVYYHALLAGFVGQYYYETGDTGELGKLKELHARQLPVEPAPTHVLREEKITPQPYAGKDPSGPRYPRQWDRLLLKAGLAVALLIPLAYLAWFFLTPETDRGPSVQQLVDRQLATYHCADLVATVDPDNAVAVSGYAATPDDVERLRRDIAATAGVKSAAFDVRVRIWPHCEVIALLKPYRERNLAQRMGLEVTPTTGHSDRFVENERVIVNLTNANQSGYLYVDYYTVEGQVAHLFPADGEPDSTRLLQPGERFDVGAAQQTWTIGPPFGQELITVIASPVPLFDQPRPLVEDDAREYLARLRGALAAGDDAGQAANFLIMQTEPDRNAGGVP
ncbi:DotU family type IV/VI secretion system protein [Luteimonas sp. BDR2-5]|uniref:DotU family type IV/VI secretion system protein n=1 Tax=Proluteimonas luteida TaxID=2878685 RepID=UPI001E5504F5|nr:DotU family type IV/VI secretion system protein [Luteimonas sp. BDR2-5]MCD9029083.1 DotU family type IV/VI secretion system protein [Luteimonas sp. BDR2-5]